MVMAVLAACGSPDATHSVPLGEIIGHVTIDDDTALPTCRIFVEGTPRGAACDTDGQFTLRALDPGQWDLRIIDDLAMSPIPSKRVTTAANPGLITDLGAIRIAKPGKIGGHLSVPPGTTAPFTVISVPKYGVTTSPDPTNHGYLLDRVPPGLHDVVLTTDGGSVVQHGVKVFAGETTIDINFDLAALEQHQVSVVGAAAASGSDDRAHIVVELVEVVNGGIKATIETGADGAFALPANQGVYLVRAHRADRHAAATIPFLAVFGATDIALTSPLVIPADGDLDGDGIPDASDTDRDGDGVPDASDAFPDDPSESVDTDGDGVGDNADLDANADGMLDHALPTPDADQDGKLDFEDNCKLVPNPDQVDTDADHVGNACDNCPGLANRDQLDSDGDGTGDVCETCIAGTSCTPAASCDVGITTCTASGAVCQDTHQPAVDGTTCGTDLVCFAGSCGPCVNGNTCTTSSGGACVVGVTSCATGNDVCLPTAGRVPDGTTCALDEVCDSGSCIACVDGGACAYAPASSCHKGRLSCATGVPQTCEDSGLTADDGTACGPSQFCHAGTCQTCAQGTACSPAAAVCHLGSYACGSGVAVCNDTGANAPDGSPCQGVGMFCASGTCITSPNALALISGGGQTANVGAALGPIIVRLADGSGTALANEPLAIDLPPGGVLVGAPPNTDGNGKSTFTVRLGDTVGTETFVVRSSKSAPLSVPMTATAVASGGSYTVINAAHREAQGDFAIGIPGPASQAEISTPGDMAIAADGTVYLVDTGTSRILKLDPAGQLTYFAGGGAGGDGGLATAARLSSPRSPVIDAAAHQLYVADESNARVRKIDLDTNIITTLAGGGSAPGPTFGDGGAATNADIGAPRAIARTAGGLTYILDETHDRIRVVDATNKISTVAIANSACVLAPGDDSALSSVYRGAMIADAAGRLYIAAYVCDGPSGGAPIGIVRRDLDGSFHHVAGRTSGTTGDGAEARSTKFTDISGLAFDAGGNLIVVDYGANKIRRIDATTGIVTDRQPQTPTARAS